MVVIKRNGKSQDFDTSKIAQAMRKAFFDVYGEEHTAKWYTELIESIADDVSEEFNGIDEVDIEEIQDAIENELMSSGQFDVAKEYIRYRYLHELRRQHRNDEDMMSLIGGDNEYWNTENSNKNATWVTTQRDYLAGIVSKDLARTYLFPEDAIKAHDDGVIHIHDMDYAIQPISNCSLVNLEDMLQNGTVINGVKIERPHRILTAATIASQVVSAVSSSQFGGVTITLTHLAPFVRSSCDIYREKYESWGFSDEDSERFAEADTRKEVADAVQTLVYQLNSLTTTNG